MLPKPRTEMSIVAYLGSFQTPILLRCRRQGGLKTVDSRNQSRLVVGTGCSNGVVVRLSVADSLGHRVHSKRQVGDRPRLLVQFTLQAKLLGRYILQLGARPFDFDPEVDRFGRVANWKPTLHGLDDAVALFDV